MKILTFLFLIFSSVRSIAQTEQKIDSIYYLLDTAKTPVNDRMWSIEADDQFKMYILKCPCLKFNGTPQFFYSVTDKEDKGWIISKREFQTIKLISLPDLITKAKQLLDTLPISRSFFLIEPEGKKYIVHNVALINPEIKIVSPPDVIVSKPDTSAFKAKGLIQVNSKNLAKCINQSVVTSGKVVNGREIESEKLDLLTVGADYPNQDFTIIVKGENGHNFYPVRDYLKRWIKVVGKVTTYMGKPAIELTDDSQIQITRWR